MFAASLSLCELRSLYNANSTNAKRPAENQKSSLCDEGAQQGLFTFLRGRTFRLLTDHTFFLDVLPVLMLPTASMAVAMEWSMLL